MNKITNGLLILIASVFILMQSKSILIPFVVAIIVWFIIKEVKQWISSINFGKKKLPGWMSHAVSFIVIFGILSLTVSLLASNINGIAKDIQDGVYDRNVNDIRAQIDQSLGISISEELRQFSSSFDFSSILSDLLNQLTSLFGNAFLVIIYVLFLMMEERFFAKKLKLFFSQGGRDNSAAEILSKIDHSMGKYISLKTIVSLITGVLSYIALVIIKVEYAFFWSFVIFLLNYIPTIGSLIATIFPALAAMLQFGSFDKGLVILVAVGAIQVVVGNFLEPKMMGNSLNISGLVVILSLSVWGWIWGIVGMLLAVPIMVMLIIIFAEIPATRGIAILLSDKGLISKST